MVIKSVFIELFIKSKLKIFSIKPFWIVIQQELIRILDISLFLKYLKIY